MSSKISMSFFLQSKIKLRFLMKTSQDFSPYNGNQTVQGPKDSFGANCKLFKDSNSDINIIFTKNTIFSHWNQNTHLLIFLLLDILLIFPGCFQDFLVFFADNIAIVTETQWSSQFTDCTEYMFYTDRNVFVIFYHVWNECNKNCPFLTFHTESETAVKHTQSQLISAEFQFAYCAPNHSMLKWGLQR